MCCPTAAKRSGWQMSDNLSGQIGSADGSRRLTVAIIARYELKQITKKACVFPQRMSVRSDNSQMLRSLWEHTWRSVRDASFVDVVLENNDAFENCGSLKHFFFVSFDFDMWWSGGQAVRLWTRYRYSKTKKIKFWNDIWKRKRQRIFGKVSCRKCSNYLMGLPWWGMVALPASASCSRRLAKLFCA